MNELKSFGTVTAPLIINWLSTCGDILVLFIILSSVFSILIFISFGYSPLQSLAT